MRAKLLYSGMDMDEIFTAYRLCSEAEYRSQHILIARAKTPIARHDKERGNLWHFRDYIRYYTTKPLTSLQQWWLVLKPLDCNPRGRSLGGYRSFATITSY